MSIKIGSSNTTFKIGNNTVIKIYHGDVLIYSNNS